MAVNESLAAASDHLFSGAIAAYALGLFALCGDYAFGKGEHRARAKEQARERAAAERTTADRELVAVGGSSSDTALDPVDGIDELPAADGGDDEPHKPSKWGPRLGLIGMILAAVGLLLQIASLTARGLATDRLPWGNMFEFGSMICVFAVATYLVLALRNPARRFLGAFVLAPVVFILVLVGLRFYIPSAPVVAPLRSYWLAIHVTAATVATGIFLVSAVVSVLYLVKAKHERREKESGDYVPSRIAGALPSSATLDRLAARTMVFAFPIWTFAIITGAIWAEAAWGRYWGWDPKETWSFISWVVYAVYLHARSTACWKGKRAAYINLLGAATMAFNFIVVNTLISGLHSYSGL